MRIQNNIAAFNAFRNLAVSQSQIGKSLEKLSSGFRINKAADDASGLVISEGLRAQIGGLRQATRNAQDGVSAVQTAEGALTEVHSILQRMRDLAVQTSSTGTYGQEARDAAQAEVAELLEEIDRIAGSTKFGTQNLLDGSFGVTPTQASAFVTGTPTAPAAGDDFTVLVAGGTAVAVNFDGVTRTGTALASFMTSQLNDALAASANAVDNAAAGKITFSAEAVGAGFVYTISNAENLGVTVADGTGTALADMSLTGLAGALLAATGSEAQFQVGAFAGEAIGVSIAAMDVAGLALTGLDVSSGDDTNITLVDAAISTVSTLRGELGAVQNRFEHTVANLNVAVENITASESRIRDTDMASEMTNFTKNQILLQAGTAMLAQANVLPQSVLALLQ